MQSVRKVHFMGFMPERSWKRHSGGVRYIRAAVSSKQWGIQDSAAWGDGLLKTGNIMHLCLQEYRWWALTEKQE